MRYTEENKQKVDSFLLEPYFKDIVEKELGLPIKVTVNWKDGFIYVSGQKHTKRFKIKDILDASMLQ